MRSMRRGSIRCFWPSAANATCPGSGRTGRPNCSPRRPRSSDRGNCRWRSISSSWPPAMPRASMPTMWSPSWPTSSRVSTGVATATFTPKQRSTRWTIPAADSTPDQSSWSPHAARPSGNCPPRSAEACRSPTAFTNRGSACPASWPCGVRGSSPDQGSRRQATRAFGRGPRPRPGRATSNGSLRPSGLSIRFAAGR